MKKSNFLLIAIALVVVTVTVTYVIMKPEKKLPKKFQLTEHRKYLRVRPPLLPIKIVS